VSADLVMSQYTTVFSFSQRPLFSHNVKYFLITKWNWSKNTSKNYYVFQDRQVFEILVGETMEILTSLFLKKIASKTHSVDTLCQQTNDIRF